MLRPSVLVGESLVAGLSRYQTVWEKQFKSNKALNCCIPGDKTHDTFYLFLHLLNLLWFVVAPTT